MNVDGDALSLEELRTLRHDNPTGLFRHLADVQKSFLFGVEDHREDESPRWGGEVRLIVNRNLELHFVPAFNDAMRTSDELPQFSVFPDEDRADTVEETSQVIDDDDEVKGAIFYVEPTEYDLLVGAATLVLERYEDFDLIPDTYFLESPLLQFVERTVLEHELVQAERKFDFRRGLVGGAPPTEQELADEPLPAIGEDDDDEDYTAHPDLVLGEDEVKVETGDDEDGESDGDDEDDEGGGPKKHFRTVWT